MVPTKKKKKKKAKTIKKKNNIIKGPKEKELEESKDL